MIPLTQLHKISRRIFKFAGRIPLQVFIRAKRGALVRFANNGVHQNGFQDLFSYTIRLISKDGPVYAESNDPSDEGIRAALRRACIMTEKDNRRAGFPPQNDADQPQAENLPYNKKGQGRVKGNNEHFPFPIERAPEMAADAIETALQQIRPKRAVANGYFSAWERSFYLTDSNGLELFHPATAFRFGVTIAKGTGKGYASFYHPNLKKLDPSNVVDQAMNFAEDAARGEVSLKPGEYECIFSPRAFLEFIEPLRRHFDEELSRARKSVFSGLLGRTLFSKSFTLLDDVRHPGQFGVPFDDEGAAKRKTTLVEHGILKELLAEGSSTRAHLEHPFYPEHLAVENGRDACSEMIRKIRRGIFINKIWYHTLVRESEMEVTGFAARGCLFIENGRIKGQAANLRYQDSILSALKSVVSASKEQLLLKDGERGAALLPYIWISKIRVV